MTTLEIEQAGVVKNGVVQYQVDESGLVTYSLKVGVRGLLFFLSEVSSNGVVSLDKELLLSKNYQQGATLTIGDVQVTVLTRTQYECVCSATSTQNGVTVENLVLDCSSDVIDVKAARVLVSQSGLDILLDLSRQ